MRKLILALTIVAVAPSGLFSQPVPNELGLGSRTGLVVSSSDIASDLGAGVLAAGGNAVDAAVATAFALAVTHPFAGNIGGGGFMVVRTAGRQGRRRSTIARPRRASRRRRCTSARTARSTRSLTATGYLAPGVPGTVRGMALAHKRFGKLPWKDVVMPAAELAAKGFVISASLARGLNERSRAAPMRPFPASVAAYGKPGGEAWAAGDRLVLPDLAKTLQRDRDRRARRVLHGLDRRSHRRGHGGARRAHHEGRSRRVPSEGARADHAARSSATTSSRCRRPAPAASRSSRCSTCSRRSSIQKKPRGLGRGDSPR